MRDNLFRGKLTEKFAEAPKMRFDLLERGIVKDGFVYGSLVVDGKRCFICISAFVGNQSYVNNAYATMFEVDPETVGQFTGVTDKNETMIFEGDIVKGIAYSITKIGVIVWIDEISSFGVRYAQNLTAWENSSILRCVSMGKTDEFAAEVIGNIHNNPELLGEPMKPASKDIAQSGLAPATEDFELLEG